MIENQLVVDMVVLVALTRGLALKNELFLGPKESRHETRTREISPNSKIFTLITEETRIIIKISYSRAIHVTVVHYSNFSQWQFLLRVSYEPKLMNNYLAEAESVSLLSGNSNIRNRN